MKFKYVFFDFDGTISDTEKINFKIFEQLADMYKIRRISYEELVNIKKMSARQLIDYLEVKKHKLPFILRRGKKLLKQNIENVGLCKKNFVDIVKALKENGVKVAIITTNSKNNVASFLDNHAIDCFDFIISSSMFGKERKIRKVMRKENLGSNDVLYVGDEIRDITAAKLSNIKIASVSWGYNTVESLLKHKPDYMLNDPSELIDICV